MQNKAKKCRLVPMEELQARPCEVDGRPALFHRWIEEITMDDYKLQALVEYRDGTIAKVDPELVQFTDKEDQVWTK